MGYGTDGTDGNATDETNGTWQFTVTLSPPQLVTLSPPQHVTLSPPQLVTLSPPSACHLVTPSGAEVERVAPPARESLSHRTPRELEAGFGGSVEERVGDVVG